MLFVLLQGEDGSHPGRSDRETLARQARIPKHYSVFLAGVGVPGVMAIGVFDRVPE
jgi:hypothetical protein